MPLFQVIKYSGPNDILIWKHPKENMKTGSKLIVAPAQEAVFIKQGKIFDILGPGPHTLSTANLPLLSAFINLPFGWHTPFTAEILFVNRLHILSIKWGTLSPIQINDPVYHIMIPVRSFGQYGIQISNSRRFIEKVSGTIQQYSTENLIDYFRGVMGSRIVDAIANRLVKDKITFGELNAHIAEMSDQIQRELAPIFEEYGVKLINFSINSLNVPENDPSVIRLHQVLDKKNEMTVLDTNYREEHTFDVMEQAAKNMSGIGGSMAEAGAGAAIGSAMADMMRETLKPCQKCPKCGADVPAGNQFCGKCGTAIALLKKRVCLKCSAALEPDAQFCGKCGYPVSGQQE